MLDIIVIAVFLICIFLGAKKGFAKTVLGFCSYILACILGVVFFDSFKVAIYSFAPVSAWLENISESISGYIENYVSGYQGSIPAFFNSYIDSVTGKVASNIGEVAVEALVAVLFIISLIIVIKLVAFFIGAIVKLPVLKQFNSILGGAVGALNGVIVCYIVGAILVFSLISSGNAWINELINSSVLGGYFFKNNLILNLLLGI